MQYQSAYCPSPLCNCAYCKHLRAPQALKYTMAWCALAFEKRSYAFNVASRLFRETLKRLQALERPGQGETLDVSLFTVRGEYCPFTSVLGDEISAVQRMKQRVCIIVSEFI